MKKILIHFLTSALLISIPLTSLTISMYTVTTIAKAGKKIELNSRKLILRIGQSKKISIKNISGKNRKKSNGVQATTPLLRLIKRDL